MRYVDAIVVFAGNKPRLQRGLAAIQMHVAAALWLEVREERKRIAPAFQSVPYLGFWVFPSMIQLDSRKWSRGCRVRGRHAAHLKGRIQKQALARSVRSMLGPMNDADTLRTRCGPL